MRSVRQISVRQAISQPVDVQGAAFRECVDHVHRGLVLLLGLAIAQSAGETRLGREESWSDMREQSELGPVSLSRDLERH